MDTAKHTFSHALQLIIRDGGKWSWIILVATKHNNFSLFDLDLWPTTLTYNSRLAKVKVDPHAKNKVKWFKQESAHRQTDGHTHTHACYQTYYLPCYTVDKYDQHTYNIKIKALNNGMNGRWPDHISSDFTIARCAVQKYNIFIRK